MTALTLADAPLATPLTIVGLPVGLARRLTRMGLREGTSFSVLEYLRRTYPPSSN